ncbi:MAG: PAS domain-containing protein, partial [Planctomycetota bacterium]
MRENKPYPTRRLRLTYIAALSIIAALTITAQVGLSAVIERLADDSTVINVAGRQRMLSQRIAKTAALLTTEAEHAHPDRAAKLAKQLRNAVDLWATTHQGLLTRDASAGLGGVNSPEIVALYAQLQPHHEQVLADTSALLNDWAQGRVGAWVEGNDQHLERVERINEGADRFLPLMNNAVNQYEVESETRVAKLNQIEVGLATATLLVLLLEALLVFEPMIRRLRRQHDRENEQAEEFERLAEVAKRTTNAVVMTDAQRRITWVNAGFTRVTGYEPEEVLGRKPGDLLQFEKSDPATIGAMRQAVRAGQPFRGEILNVGKTGREYWLDIDIQPRRNEQGELIGFVAVEADITEQVHAREASERAFREVQALRGALDEHALLSIADRSGKIIDVNTGFCRISGYEREELLGQDHRVLNSGAHPKAFWRDIWSTIASGRAWRGEVCNRAKDGSLYWVDSTIVPHLGPNGKIEKYVSIRFDITAKKEAQRDVEALRAALDEHSILSIADRRGRIIEANAGFCRISGYQRDELIGQDHRVLNAGHHPKAFWVDMWKTIAAGKAWRAEVCNRAKDGSLYWVDSTIVPHLGADGKIEKYISIRFDITAQKLAEQQSAEHQAQLAQLQRRFERALDGASDGLWDYKPDAGTVWYSPQFKRLLGLHEHQLDQFPGTLSSFADRLHPNDYQPTFDAVNAHLEHDTPYDVKYRLRTESGAYRWFRARARSVRDNTGRAITMSGSICDVHDQHTAESRLDLATRAARISLWDWDIPSGQTFFSETFFSMLGYEPGELPMTLETWKRLCHPDDLQPTSD